MHIESRRTSLREGHIVFGMRGSLWLLCLLFTVLPCLAHPMGNFSISHYSEITIDHDGVTVRYLLDLAEIPTFQEMQQAGMNASHDDPKLPRYIEAKSREFGTRLRVSVDGRDLTLLPLSRNLVFTPGAGGLPTMKFGFLYRAKIATPCKVGSCELNYEDTNFPGRAGWKEIVVKRERGVTLTRSTASDEDRSSQLSNYPTDLVNSPPQSLHASVSFVPIFAAKTETSRPSMPTVSRVRKGAESSTHSDATAERSVATASLPEDTNSAVPLASVPDDRIEITPNRQKTPRSAFTEIMATRKLGLGMTLLAALIAAGLGALHALEPGHGKTIVAAYLVGAKGTARHAFLLGMIVTITHTAGVYMLGAITLYAQKYILPEKLYPFLGVLSGILIAGMGFYLFLQRFAGEVSPLHTHGGVAHTHGGFLQTRAASNSETDSESAICGAQSTKSIPARQLLILGITGGIVPCPAALVVLLSGLALHRVLFGLFLIVAFSAGLAAVLIVMGMVAVYAGRMLSRANSEGPLFQRWLPLTSAVMITALGCAIAVRALMTAGIVQFHI